ncbi:MAG: biopolymer transporter ExbD [bacterium]|nr:biopolymer transporter ExbD [bacterium]
MSKNTARINRMARRHKFRKPATIQLTSLIDILTVLVFFLLVNSQNVTNIPDSQQLTLPKSTAEKRADDTVLTVMINQKSIVVQGRKVADSAAALQITGDIIPELAKELAYRASKTAPKLNPEGIPEREILILGDKAISYTLLRKVMATSSASDYSKISFAVLRTKEATQ